MLVISVQVKRSVHTYLQQTGYHLRAYGSIYELGHNQNSVANDPAAYGVDLFAREAVDLIAHDDTCSRLPEVFPADVNYVMYRTELIVVTPTLTTWKLDNAAHGSRVEFSLAIVTDQRFSSTSKKTMECKTIPVSRDTPEMSVILDEAGVTFASMAVLDELRFGTDVLFQVPVDNNGAYTVSLHDYIKDYQILPTATMDCPMRYIGSRRFKANPKDNTIVSLNKVMRFGLVVPRTDRQKKFDLFVTFHSRNSAFNSPIFCRHPEFSDSLFREFAKTSNEMLRDDNDHALHLYPVNPGLTHYWAEGLETGDYDKETRKYFCTQLCETVFCIIDEVRQLPFASGKVYFSGLSAGAFMTFCMLRYTGLHPRNFPIAGAYLHSAHYEYDLVALAKDIYRVDMCIVHGVGDLAGPINEILFLVDCLNFRRFGVGLPPIDFEQIPGGHGKDYTFAKVLTYFRSLRDRS